MSLNARFRGWINRNPVRFSQLHADLVSSRAGMTIEHYIGIAFTVAVLTGLVMAVLAFFLTQLILASGFYFNIVNVFPISDPGFASLPDLVIRVIAALVVFFISGWLTYVILLKYPGMQASTRATKINLTLHNAVSYMYAMRRGGAEIIDIFTSISENADIYGEVALEFRRVIRDTQYFGYDIVTAIRQLADTSPSEKMKDFLEDMISVIDSGGDLSVYLASRVKLYQEEARFEQNQFLTTMSLIAETYVTVFVAGPLFLIIIMVVMGMMGGAAASQMSVIVYAMLPIGSIIFILFIDLISIKESVAKRVSRQKELKEFSEVKRREIGAEEDLFARLRHYDRVRAVREFVRHPLQGFIYNVNRTLLITVPAALLYLLLVYANVPSYLDFETTINIIDDHLIIALLIILIPYSLFYEFWRRRINGIEQGIPDFLDRLASINRVGLNIAQAISVLVKTNLGVISYEIKRIKRDLDWGGSVNDALVRFEERVQTPGIARSVTLITKASQMSGDIGEVLTIASSDAKTSETLKRDRFSEMFIYTAIIYLAFFVFIFVVLVLETQFITVLENIEISQTAGAAASGMFTSLGGMPIDMFRRLLYHACVIQALFSGLIAGAMGEVSVKAGVKHAAIMMVIALIAFSLIH